MKTVLGQLIPRDWERLPQPWKGIAMETQWKTCGVRSAVFTATLALLVAVAAWAQQPADGTLAAQRSAAGGVTVTVRPLDLAATSKTWAFEVVLDTHSQDLSDDLPAAAVLVDDRGDQHAPTEWQGDPPGGHHRKGTLGFAPLTPRPAWIELRIQRPGEPLPRALRWQLDEGNR